MEATRTAPRACRLRAVPVEAGTKVTLGCAGCLERVRLERKAKVPVRPQARQRAGSLCQV